MEQEQQAGPAPAQPLEAALRDPALDALRGAAILGLALVNVRHFAFPFAGELYPPLRAPFTGPDGTAHMLVSMLAEFKFLSVLAVLFGAGMALREKRWAAAEGFGRFYGRWLAGLGLIGLLHGTLLWFGDILFLYSLAGLAALRLRKLDAERLLWLAAALVFAGGALPALGFLAQGEAGRHVELLSALLREQTRVFSSCDHAAAAALNARMFAGVTVLALPSLGLRVLGLFLLGAWLGREDRLRKLASGHAWLHGAAALAIGLAMERAAAGAAAPSAKWCWHYSGSLAAAAGYFILLTRVFSSSARLAAPFACVGRTALSNYLLQSAACAAVFFPWGAGLFGDVPLSFCLAFALCLIAAQAALSAAWLRSFHWGPLEFLLRGFSYGSFPAFAREGGPVRALAAGAALAAVLFLAWSAAAPSARLFGPAFHRGRPERRAVALTFDDGPNANHTAKLLDLLAKEKVRATFFLTGANAQAYPALVRRLAREGHEIGNHSWSHRPLALSLSGGHEDIAAAQRILRDLSGKEPALFRPPYGLRNPAVLHAAAAQGMLTVLWSDWGLDWGAGRWQLPADRIAGRILRGARSGDIILMHDGYKNARGADKGRSVEAAALVIAGLRARGFSFAAVSELLR